MSISAISNVFSTYGISSAQNSQQTFRTSSMTHSQTDTVSLSQEAKDLFAAMKQEQDQRKYGEFVFDETGTLDTQKTLGQTYSHLSLNDAVAQRITSDGFFINSLTSSENGKDTYQFSEDWSEENKALYKKYEKEYKELYEKLPENPEERSPENLKALNDAHTKLWIVATHGHTHKLSEEMVDEATVVFNETQLEHRKATGQVSGDEKPLTGLILLQSLDEDEVAEELEKMKEEFTKQIASAPTTKHDVQSDNNISSSSENKAEKTGIPYYLNMLHQNQSNE